MRTLTRRASIGPSTLNLAGRTVEVVAATPAPVRRAPPQPDGSSAPWEEALAIGAEAISLDRFVGAPVLTDHRQATEAVVGVVEAARVVGEELLAVVRFATTPRADEVMQLVADGVLTGVSIGYKVATWECAPTGEPPRWVAARWAPFELSFVAVPADANARVRSSSEVTMTDKDVGGVPPAPRAPVAVQPAPMPPEHLLFGRFGDEGRLRALSGWEAQHRSAGWTGDLPPLGSPDFARRQQADALASRALGREPPPHAREFAGARIADLARDALVARGERVSRFESVGSILTRALTTSDFPALLASAFGRTLTVLAPADSPVRALTRRREVADFRTIESITFSTVPSLEEIGEGGEVELGAPAERKEAGRLKTFARRIDISLQALVNDDLGAFADAARVFAAAVADREAVEFARLFAANGTGWGPTMSDGKPLFHADHGNVAAGAMGTAGLGTARQKMREQTMSGGVPIRAVPRHVLVGPVNETAAEQALSNLALATAEGQRPVFSGQLALHVEPRLSGTPWFVFADPAELAIAEHVVLAGTGGAPQVDRYDAGPERLGMSVRAVHHFAVLPVDWRGAVRMTGA